MRVPGLRDLPVGAVARRVWREVGEDDLAGQAAQLAYYFLFSLFPLLLFLVTLIGYLPVPDLFGRMMEWAAAVLPPQALSLVEDTLATIATERRGGLLSLGALGALWGASAGFRAVMNALNRAYDVREGRPWWVVYGLSLGATVGLVLVAVVAFALLVFGPQIGAAVAGAAGLGEAFQVAWNVLRWPVALVLLALVLAAVYHVAPDVEQDWKWVTPGSALAVVGWALASAAFSYYVQSFGSYDKTYGSLGAVIVLLTWLYLTGAMLLLGGEVNAVVEHMAPGRARRGAGVPRAAGAAAAVVPTAGRPAAVERGSGPPPAVLPDLVPGGRGRRAGERRAGERRAGERRGGHLRLVHGAGGAAQAAPGAAAERQVAAPPSGVAAAGARTTPAGHLLGGLAAQARRLARLHLRLAAAEFRVAGRRMKGGIGLAAAGGVVAAVGLLYLTAAVVVLLGGVLPLWLAALAVSGVGLALSVTAVRLGIGEFRARGRGAAAAATADQRASTSPG